MTSVKWLPVIDSNLCNGCNACVEACVYLSLECRDGVAVLVNAESCQSDEHCLDPCPVEGAIGMGWLPWNGSRALGLWRED